MEPTEKKIVVRCRGIAVDEGKLLVVRHPHDTSFAALPGGKLEWGEDIKECMRREMVEELGIEPAIGRLLYLYNFVDRYGNHSIECFFEITNAAAYRDYANRDRTHADELAEIAWVSPGETLIKPEEIGKDFAEGTLLSDTTRVIRGA